MSPGSGTKTLVFDDGSGLTVSNNGSFWREHPKEIKRAVEFKKAELLTIEAEILEVLEVSGFKYDP